MSRGCYTVILMAFRNNRRLINSLFGLNVSTTVQCNKSEYMFYSGTIVHISYTDCKIKCYFRWHCLPRCWWQGEEEHVSRKFISKHSKIHHLHTIISCFSAPLCHQKNVSFSRAPCRVSSRWSMSVFIGTLSLVVAFHSRFQKIYCEVLLAYFIF